jgi:hypothetical protein
MVLGKGALAELVRKRRHLMKRHIDVKSAGIGAVAGFAFMLLAGATAERSLVVGRFQIACTDSACWLVDTATGQVWYQGDPGFKAPKLAVVPAAQVPEAVPAGAEGFVGQWHSDHPDEDDLGLRLEADGRALATEGSRRYEGRWRVEGGRIFVTIDDETVTGEIGADGRLILWAEGDEDERIPFRRIQ